MENKELKVNIIWDSQKSETDSFTWKCADDKAVHLFLGDAEHMDFILNRCDIRDVSIAS